jgi:hypothetical protein
LATEASDGIDMFSAWRKTSKALVSTPQTAPAAAPHAALATTPILSREATLVS